MPIFFCFRVLVSLIFILTLELFSVEISLWIWNDFFKGVNVNSADMKTKLIDNVVRGLRLSIEDALFCPSPMRFGQSA